MGAQENHCIYILSNRAIPNLVKIGRTGRHPAERAAELSRATGIPAPFEVEAFYSIGSMDAAIRAEKFIHEQLCVHRDNQRREFFHLSVEAATKLVEGYLKQQGVDVHGQMFDKLFALCVTGVTLEEINPTGDRKLGVEDGREWPLDAERGLCESVLRLDRTHPNFLYLMGLYADFGLHLPDSSEYVIGFNQGVHDYAGEIERRIIDREWQSEQL